MAGMEIVLVSCDENGNINVDELREKAVAHKDRLSCLMITYPSTHGVFEKRIREIISIIHENGGLVIYGRCKYERTGRSYKPRIHRG